MMSRSRRIMRSRPDGAVTPSTGIGLRLISPVHFGSSSVAVRPFEPEVSVFDAHGLCRSHSCVVPEETALWIYDVDFFVFAGYGIAQRRQAQFYRARDSYLRALTRHTDLDRLADRPVKALHCTSECLPWHSAHFARKDCSERVHLLLTRFFVHKEDTRPGAFGISFRLLG